LPVFIYSKNLVSIRKPFFCTVVAGSVQSFTESTAFCTRAEIFANALFWVEVGGAPLIFTFDQAFANTKWRYYYWGELFSFPTATAS
jgi:hypothetical protein